MFLRVASVEVGEEGGVRGEEKSRGIVCHWVRGSWNVVMAGNIAVKALVHAEETEEVGRRGSCGGAATALPKEGGKIVSLAKDGALAGVISLG